MEPTNKKPLLDDGIILNGKWEILEHLATGGKGEVYRARQTNLDREVVVKTVSIQYLAEFDDDPEEVETEIKRFHREAMAMAQVRHPYVVQVYDHDAAAILKNGEEVTVRYVVMEYVPGSTLRATMPESGFGSNEQAARIWIRDYFVPILDGIEPIHEMGIIHRDIKPENVLLDGITPKITDFGIAGGAIWPSLTRSHHVEGTILYMAPEQFTDLGESDVRADVYALGKILYEAMCGKMVDSRTACPLRGVCLGNVTTPFSKGLDLVVRQATAEDKDQRIPSVMALRERLIKLLEEAEEAERPLLRGLHRRQKGFIIALVIAFVGIVGLSNLYHHYYMLHEFIAPGHQSPPGNTQSPAAVKEREPASHERLRDGSRSTLIGKDGVTMHLIPAGEVKLPNYFGAEAGKPFKVGAFYMDETNVTNYKYVEFLNQIPARITVKNGVVLGDGHPWLKLGPVFAGYEPILYENGRFRLKDSSAASYPVVRVSGYGAAAYATFYGERLPSELEWLHAAARSVSPAQGSVKDGPAGRRKQNDLEKDMTGWISGYAVDDLPSAPYTPGGPSQVPHPVAGFKPNRDGIRGLQENVSEWGLRYGSPPESSPHYVILGGLRGSMLLGETLIPGVAQDPSGEFVDVGFRCTLKLRGSSKE